MEWPNWSSITFRGTCPFRKPGSWTRLRYSWTTSWSARSSSSEGTSITRSFRQGDPWSRTSTFIGVSRSIWCERGELNPHELPHGILSPARLPIPPLSRWLSCWQPPFYQRSGCPSRTLPLSGGRGRPGGSLPRPHDLGDAGHHLVTAKGGHQIGPL